MQQLQGRTAAAAGDVCGAGPDPGGREILEWYVQERERERAGVQPPSLPVSFPSSLTLAFGIS